MKYGILVVIVMSLVVGMMAINQDVNKNRLAIKALSVAQTNEPSIKITWARQFSPDTPVVIETGYGNDGMVYYRALKKTAVKKAPKKRWWKKDR